jgi:hypothetical protein
MSVDISVSITEDIVDIIATPTVNIVNVTNSASIDPGLYDLSEFTNTSLNPFVRTSGLSSYVPTSRTLTINGLAQDLSADRSWTISTGLTVGTTPISSGTIGRVLFEGTGNVVQESANLFWDNANIRLGIGTSAPSSTIEVVGTAKVTTLLPTTGGFTGSVGTSAVPFANMYAVNYNSPGNATLIASQSTYLGAGNTFGFALFQSTRNVLIQNGGTYTDAGYRLDVNGTTRVQGVFETTQHAYLNNGVWCDVYRNRFGAEVFRITLTSNNMLVGTTTDVASAVLNVASTTKGFLPPRGTNAQMLAIASPAKGLIFFDNTNNKLNCYDGTTWQPCW